MNVQIQPLQEQIDTWIENHVPDKDLFFLREQDLSLLTNEELQGTLLMPEAEFFNHSSYKGIQLVNSCMYWTISKEVQFVIVAQPDWLTNLPLTKKEALFSIQYAIGKGLLFPLHYFSETAALPKEHIIKENGVQGLLIRKAMWTELPYSYKEEAIKAYAQEYDDWTSLEIPANIPVHIKNYANTFSTDPGANCLAAALYAISTTPERDEWIIHEWIHPETFAEGLKNAFYSPTDDKFQKGDVVTWVNEEGVIQHAAYCIDDQLLFNKNGQTFFNPWKIVQWDDLKEEWERYTPQVYRKI